MNAERTDYVARTSAGVLISTFASRDMAMTWADAEGDKFPGYTVAVVTERTTITERVLRRDRSHLREVA